MKTLYIIIIALFIGVNTVLGQSADPAVTGANFVPNQINTGQTSLLTVSFANTGSTAIAVNSIELTISTAYNYYTTNGTTPPSGAGAAFFNWTYLGTSGSSDIWRGSNKVSIGAFEGGNIFLTVTGNTASSGFETTNVTVQPVNSFSDFNDSQNNNNLYPQLKINQDCPNAPVLVANSKSNVCPTTTADLTSLQPAVVSGQTYEWHTVSSNPSANTLVSNPTQVSGGTYYLYSKSTCYSPASQPVIVTITVCTSPDLTIAIGQPLPSPIVAQPSFIPVTVTNIGSAPTTGSQTVVLKIPTGTGFGTFPVNNNGWTCSTSGITATCVNPTSIANGANSIFNVPFIATASQAGTPLTIPSAVVSGGGEPLANTGNNTSNTITTPNVGGANLTPNFTFSSTSFTVGAIKSLVVNINEIGNISTNGTAVEVFIPYSAGFTYAFSSSQTSVTVVGIEVVNNPDWTLTVKPAGLLLSSTTIIPANGRSRIGLAVTADKVGTVANITANITPNGGGETNPYNNVISLAQSVQK